MNRKYKLQGNKFIFIIFHRKNSNRNCFYLLTLQRKYKIGITNQITMSLQGTIRRYTLEIEKISESQFPSFESVKQYLHDNGFEISKRTLQRDIEDIRYEFGVDIHYNRLKNGYFINLDNSPNFESFLNFLEIVNTAGLLTDSLIKSKETLKYLSFESMGPLKGIQQVKDLLFAAINHRKVSFYHYNYATGQNKRFTICPYLLKEHLKRWYILGTLQGGELRLFGIDRIENLVIESATFIPKESVDVNTYFDNIIGLSNSKTKPIEVVLEFTSFQGNYIKSLPLHHSQQIIKDDKNSFIISLKLIPNLELLQRICMYGDQVKILKPDSLVQELKQTLLSALNQY
jgi:predicted DNA-binding transcriptional regulator YafY